MQKFNNFLTLLLFSFLLIGQTQYNGPDDLAGDPSAIRSSYMDGNRVLLYFQNTTELSDWSPGGLDNVSIWPNDGTGTKMVDGIALLIAGKVYIEDDNNSETIDTVIIDDLDQILDQSIAKHEIYFLQTSYREEMDHNASNTLDWGFYPVFGYFNPNQDEPAMSDKPDTWPVDGWPASGMINKWNGVWDGRFGKGVQYADLETYFVANDAQDQENLQGPVIKYYPRPGREIQSDASFGAGLPWGGLGIRVETRGFQWNNPLVKNALFFEYNITNISDYNINDVSFGYWVDNAIGSDGNTDEVGYFDTYLDLSYSWDYDGIGLGTVVPGIMGFAFLESPGIKTDNIDNDDDGLVDESRSYDKGYWEEDPYAGISDLNQFLEFYNLQESDLRPHWSGDEDQDWFGSSFNEDGSCNPNDDVGLDGIGPGDLNYNGPDEGECNGMPDCVEGLGCEPNFSETDISESDMIGLTTFQLFPIDEAGHSNKTGVWFYNDSLLYEMMEDTILVQYSSTPANLVELFASGTFSLSPGQTERISMAELHSFDPIVGSPGVGGVDATSLFELKTTVQLIYETDYRFAKPPRLPTLYAEAGDGQVVLTWNDVAESSRDQFLPDSLQYDFEGYKLYRATDKYFKDSQLISDGFGNPLYNQPIFQCDRIDGITGFSNWAPVFGTGYYLGDDSGLKHHYIDTDVINGKTYYYALVAYDYGLAPTEDLISGIPPSENNWIIDLNDSESVVGYGRNVAVVIPHVPSSSFVEPVVNVENYNLLGTGDISVDIMAKNLIKDKIYQLIFKNDTLFSNNNAHLPLMIVTNGFEVFSKIADTDSLELVYSETGGYDDVGNPNSINQNITFESIIINGNQREFWSLDTSKDVITDIFDGIQLTIHQDVKSAFSKTQGWYEVFSPDKEVIILPFPSIDHRESKLVPWDCDIIFMNEDSLYIETNVVSYDNIYNHDDVKLEEETVLINNTYDFKVYNRSLGQSANLVVQDMNGNGEYEKLSDLVLVGSVDSEGIWIGTSFVIDFRGILDSSYPDPGDIYSVEFKRPFWSTDTLNFQTFSFQDSINVQAENNSLDDIRVVPNPYVGTNIFEEAILNSDFNQRRKLMFTHLPARCKIKIYTISGVLVDEINVFNASSNGIAYWDLLTNEGLEIAAGMYVYHVESFAEASKGYKVGKFGVIK
jgi:hypothetical protein|tara:strand:+ start:2406 stop:5924 length:3519 start_codon:yes stop_codon:yes gene_type:complete